MADIADQIALAIRDEIAAEVPRMLRDVREAMLKTAEAQPLSVRVSTAALLVGVSVRTVERWMEDGILPWKKVGSMRLVSHQGLKELVTPETEI